MTRDPVAFDPPFWIEHGFVSREGDIRRFSYGGQEFHIYCMDVSFLDPPEPTTYEGISDGGLICTVRKDAGKWFLLALRPSP